MRLVVALGGNALLRRGQEPGIEAQRKNLRRVASTIAGLAAEHELIITHGNGPQVGLLALQTASAGPGRSTPLDVLNAETEGMIGYLIECELRQRLPSREFATVLTMVGVDLADPGFERPSKPIGPFYNPQEAVTIGDGRGWAFGCYPAGYRRLVPSPEPGTILQLGTVTTLVERGVTVICAGGGGIPVVRTTEGLLEGVEAVIDKDLCSAKLACDLDADGLVLLTNVDAAYQDWGAPTQHPMERVRVAEARCLDFEEGTMGPKIEAACRYATFRRQPAYIGLLEQADDILAGTAGTMVLP